jgi:hypothetical protein
MAQRAGATAAEGKVVAAVGHWQQRRQKARGKALKKRCRVVL